MLAHLSNRKSCWLLLAGVENLFPGAGCLPSLLAQDLGEHSLVLPLLEWQSEFLLEIRMMGMVNAKLEVSTSHSSTCGSPDIQVKKVYLCKTSVSHEERDHEPICRKDCISK